MTNLESLRDLLIDQYMLHEVQHHPATTRQTATTGVAPIAHTPVDVYKCLHQGEFGVGHLVGDLAGFRERLGSDLLSHPPAPHEPLLESVATDGRVLRVNLRPYRALFGTEADRAREQLTDVCLDSASVDRGSPDAFLSKLSGFRELNAACQLAVGGIIYMFPPETVDRFLLEVRDLVRRMRDIPVFSHSAIYRRMNNPSYRVVDLDVLERSPLSFLLQQQKA